MRVARQTREPWLVIPAALSLLLSGPARAVTIEDPGQGPVEMARGKTGASQLSAITHAGADRYYTTSDRGRMFPARIEIDPETGRVTDAALERGPRIQGGRDLEGAAFTDRDTLLVCDEAIPAIREHRIEDGAVVREVEIPEVFRGARLNLSLESLALAEGGRVLWTANEEALGLDGPTATGDAGTLVRIQCFDANAPCEPFVAAGQWAYRTDPWPGGPLGGYESSGVVDLLVLPDGELLVLERALSNQGFRNRIYGVDFDGATDTSGLASLARDPHRPVRKRLLWEASPLGFNFEGLTLGPRLAGGDRSLLLVADDSGITTPHLYALRVRAGGPPAAPPPTD